MAFVLQDVINEIEETRSLDPLKKLKRYSHAVWVKKFMFDIRLDY